MSSQQSPENKTLIEVNNDKYYKEEYMKKLSPFVKSINYDVSKESCISYQNRSNNFIGDWYGFRVYNIIEHDTCKEYLEKEIERISNNHVSSYGEKKCTEEQINRDKNRLRKKLNDIHVAYEKNDLYLQYEFCDFNKETDDFEVVEKIIKVELKKDINIGEVLWIYSNIWMTLVNEPDELYDHIYETYLIEETNDINGNLVNYIKFSCGT